jgi:hypothetical protein
MRKKKQYLKKQVTIYNKYIRNERQTCAVSISQRTTLSSIAAAIVLESKNCAACASLAPASAIVCTFCVCEFVHVYTHAHARTHTYAHAHTHKYSEREREKKKESERARASERERERERARASARERQREGGRGRTQTHTHTHTHRPTDGRTYHTCTTARLDIEPGMPRVRSDKSQIRILPSDPDVKRCEPLGEKFTENTASLCPLRQKSCLH